MKTMTFDSRELKKVGGLKVKQEPFLANGLITQNGNVSPFLFYRDVTSHHKNSTMTVKHT